MKLTIKSLSIGDFGNYRCISKNSLGETEGSIRVYGRLYCFKCSQLITVYHNSTEIPLPATPSKQVIIAEPKESELNLVSEHNFVMPPREYHFETDETYFHTESIQPFCMNVAH
jgi:hypothetical protein